MLRMEADYKTGERKISFAKVKRNLSRRNQKLQDVISVPCTALIPAGTTSPKMLRKEAEYKAKERKISFAISQKESFS